MFDKQQASHTLGLELDGSVIRGVGLAYSRGKPVLEASLSFSIEQEETDDVKPLYNEEDKKRLLGLAYKHLVVSLLPPQDVLVRPLELNLKKESDIDSVLAFQTEPMLPFPIENALIDKIILEKNKDGTKISVTAARKDRLQQHLEIWDTLDVQPEVVGTAPTALALFSKFFSPTKKPHFAFHAGLNYSLCALIENGKPIAAQSIPHGLNELAEAFAKDRGVSYELALMQLKDASEEFQTNENPLLKASIENFRIALTRTIYALTKQFKGQEIGEILLSGECCTIPWLAKALVSTQKYTLLIPQAPPGFFSSNASLTSEQIQTNALPIGVALSALPRSQDQINFLQGEYRYPDPWKRLKLPVLAYLGLCFGIGLALIFFGKAYARYQEAELKKEYIDLLRTVNKPYTELEKEIAKKFSKKELSPEEIPDIASMPPENISDRLSYLEKEIQSTPQTFPLLPNVPLVSDVLAWISTHPNVVGANEEKNSNTQSLQIESFSYAMIKRPELSKKQEKYQVKVELEFSSPTPKMAREFHDALIAPNDIVDPKGEIKWSSGKDRYRTSFYLKDRTIYTN